MAILRFPITLTYESGGSPGVNVFHGRAGGIAGTISSQAQDLTDVLHDFYAALAVSSTNGGIYSSDTTITLGTVVDVETDEQYSPTFSEITGAGGTSESAPVLCIVVGWRTSIAARRGMGRTFLGPVIPACVENNGTIASAALTNVNAVADQLVSDSEGLTDKALGVWGLQTAGGGPTDPHVLRDFTSANVRDQFGVLRSRRD